MSIEAADVGMWAQLFLCCEVRLQPRGRRPLSWAGPQLFAMWGLSLGVVLGACSAGGVFLVDGAFIERAPGVLRADFK